MFCLGPICPSIGSDVHCVFQRYYQAVLVISLFVIMRHVQCIDDCFFSLRPCGHTFCYDCIKTVMLTDMHRHLEHRYDIPAHLRNVSEKTTVAQFWELRRYITGKDAIPPSTCPLCRDEIVERPGQASILTGFISTLVSSTTPKERANQLHVVESDGAFEGLFVY